MWRILILVVFIRLTCFLFLFFLSLIILFNLSEQLENAIKRQAINYLMNDRNTNSDLD